MEDTRALKVSDHCWESVQGIHTAKVVPESIGKIALPGHTDRLL